MKFSLDKNLTFEQAKALFFEQLGDWKIMALASSVNDYVMVRTRTSAKQSSFTKTPMLPSAMAAFRWKGLRKTAVWL